MRKIIQRFPWFQLFVAAILLATGIGTIAFASMNKIGESLYITWAMALFLVALTIILIELLVFTVDIDFMGLIIAGICVGVGFFVWFKYANIQAFISLLLPYILIAVGSTLLLKTLVLAIQRIPFKDWLGMFILAVIFLTIGIIFLIVDNKLEILYIVLGVLLIIVGAVEAVGFVTVMSHRHHDKKHSVVVKDDEIKTSKQSSKREKIEVQKKKDIKLLK